MRPLISRCVRRHPPSRLRIADPLRCSLSGGLCLRLQLLLPLEALLLGRRAEPKGCSGRC